MISYQKYISLSDRKPLCPVVWSLEIIGLIEVTKKSLGYWGTTISEAGIETLGSSMGTLPRTLGKTGRCQTHFWTSQNACYPRNTLANASKDG